MKNSPKQLSLLELIGKHILSNCVSGTDSVRLSASDIRLKWAVVFKATVALPVGFYGLMQFYDLYRTAFLDVFMGLVQGYVHD